jgi:hypothetical protein
MNWFGTLFLFFQNISKRSGSQGFQLVALLFGIPCFEISNRSFKIAYAINQRRLRRVGLNCASLGGHDLSIEFNELGRIIASAPKGRKGLDDVRRALERAERATDFSKTVCYGQRSTPRVETHRLG